MKTKHRAATLLFLLAALAGAVQAQGYAVEPVMTGLVNPRGLAFGPDGGLYVAEAGNGGLGGTGPSFTLGSGNVAFLGSNGAVTRLLGGVQSRVMTGLPSVSQANGAEPGGLSDILFDGSGQAWGLIGLGANPTARNTLLGPVGAELGTLTRLTLDGSNARLGLADVSAHELASNPDGTTVDSNPFKFAPGPGGSFLVADAGGNDLLSVSATGVVSTLAVLPARPNPLPFGPPVYQSVPTGVAVGPDGAYYLGQLTGFPFPPGAASVYRVDPLTLGVTVAQSGFTNIMDLSFDAAGNMYVLQISSNGLANAPSLGLLVRIDAQTGERSSFTDAALVAPGGMLVQDDGTIYISTRTNGVSGPGEVLMLTPVPEPATVMLWLAGVGLLVLVRSRSLRRPCA